jgi:hypothetical protein
MGTYRVEIVKKGSRFVSFFRRAAGGSAGVELGEIEENGGRYRIRTYDFHRVRMALYR